MIRNLKIKTKLLLAFLILAVLSGAAGIIGIVLLNTTDQVYSHLLTNYGFLQGSIGKLGEDFQAHRASVLYVIVAEDQEAREKQEQQLKENLDTIDKDMGVLESQISLESDRKVYQDIKSQLEEYKGYRDQVIALSYDSPSEAMILFRQSCAPRAAKIAETIDSFLNEKSGTGIVLSEDISNQSRIFMVIMTAFIILSLIISAVISVSVTRGITKPLSELTGAAKHLASGNLKVDITYESQDEIGEVSSSMRHTVSTLQNYIGEISLQLENLSNGILDIDINSEFQGDFIKISDSLKTVFNMMNQTLLHISLSANQVSAGSEQVSAGAQALSHGTAQQASSVEELAAAIAEISQKVNHTAERAHYAQQQTGAAGDQAELCNGKMQEMIDAMEEISQSSGEIGKIIKTIEDIAFQTNILALNAALPSI